MAKRSLLPVLGVAAALALVGAVAMALVLPGAERGAAAVGGPFALTAQDGSTVTQAALQGHPTLVFFGYTHCPDVCPTTLASISAIMKALGPAKGGDAPRVLFVTVDPQRDTPAVLRDYLDSFDPRITGLTGTPEAVGAIERGYKVYAKAVPDHDGTYTMDHTAMTYLMDKRGRFVSGFNLDRPPAAAAAELKSYE